MTLISTIDLVETTTDGRYRVTIETMKTDDDERRTEEDHARSLSDLGGILTDCAQMAIHLSHRLLDEAGGVLTTTEETDPRRI